MINIDFYIKNLRWLYVVFILTFCSAFGQTFFISLYSGEIRAAFELTHGQWGLIYSCATLSSAILFLFVGGYAERISAKRLSTLVIFGLIVFVFLMANNTSTWGLVFIILGLRFFGQGMLGHISMVFCGKWFFKNKGKAVAVANSGYTLAEAIMPTIFVALIGLLSWQTSWYVSIIMSILILASVRFLAKTERNKGTKPQKENQQVGMLKKSWKRSEMLRSWVFWAAVPGLITSYLYPIRFKRGGIHRSIWNFFPRILRVFISGVSAYGWSNHYGFQFCYRTCFKWLFYRLRLSH